jgi:hypothetical protein
VTADENGNYWIALPPGDYVLDIQDRGCRHVRDAAALHSTFRSDRARQKEKPLVTRARTSQPRTSTKKEEKLHDLLAPHLPTAAKAWVDGLKATKTMWNQQSHQFEDTGLPDHKVRADCAQRIWENVVGRPIERSMQVTGNYKELTQVLEELKQSPEARRLLPPEIWGIESGQSNVKGKDAAHEGSTISQS